MPTTLLGNDTDVDGNPLTISSVQGAVNGSVALVGGNVVFTPTPGYNGPASFTYTISDGAGGSDTATVTLNVGAVNDAPTVGNALASVSEEGLSNGLMDDLGNPTDITNSTTSSGTISVTDPDSAVTVTLIEPSASLTSAGVAVVWTLTDDGHTLVGAAGTTEVIRATITDAGAYNVTLFKSIDHDTGGGENLKSFNISVSATDGEFVTQGTLTINVEDDAPNAAAASQKVVVPAQDTNIMLILDTSGSMNDDADGIAGGPTRLAVMKTSVNLMLDQYDNLGDAMVRIVTFANGASERDATWVTVARAKEIVNGLTAGNGTNYDAALLTAQAAFTDSGKIAGATNVSYFLTDGTPTSSSDWDGTGGLSNTVGIQTGEEAIWRSFLDANQINSMAYGMGTGATQANMNPVAYNGITHTNTNAIVVANPAVDLPPILRDSIVGPAAGDLVSGVLGAGSGFGADGGHLASFALNGTTYFSDGTLSGSSRGSFDSNTHVWTVSTLAGGKFVMDMDTSQYTFVPPATISTQYNESIGYALLDNDGDSASSTLTINVLPPQIITLTSDVTVIGSLNMGLAGEYFGYNDNRTGTTSDPTYSGTTAVRLHSDDGAADAGVANNIDTLADVEAIIEGRNNNTDLVNNAILSDPTKADATFSANKLEFGLQAGSNTLLFSNDLGQNGKVTSGAIGATATNGGTNNLYTFLKVTSGNVDGLVATSGLGDTTDAVIRMVGYIYIPAGGTYDLRITADDGYRVLIGGQNVAQLDFIQSTATNVYAGKAISEGLQPIEILYWDQGGHASLRVELKSSGTADSTYKIIGNDEFALFSPSNVPTLTANQDIVESATNGVWTVREGDTFTGTDASEKVVGSDGRDAINTGGGDDVIRAGAGNDTVNAGDGSDVISGGAGHDLLTGGLGSDTFVWTLADQGIKGSPARDTITDFDTASQTAGGDVLDLRDLLTGENHTTGTGNLSSYLHFEKSGSDTVVHISSSGEFSSGFTAAKDVQTITLSGVDLLGTSGTDQSVIQSLLNNNKLITD